MTHYSDKEAMCRVDFFRFSIGMDSEPVPDRPGEFIGQHVLQGLKWYTTEPVKFKTWNATGSKGLLIMEAFEEALASAGIGGFAGPEGKGRFSGMLAVCLEPYHEYAHPIAMVVPDDWGRVD